MKIGHIALSVGNLRRSVAFYKKNFGFKCVRSYVHPEIGLTITFLKKSALTLELFQFKKHYKFPVYRRELDSDLRTIGVKHFSFEMSNIKEAFKRFKKAKVKFATNMRTFDNGQRYFFVRDPDGIPIELMETHK